MLIVTTAATRAEITPFNEWLRAGKNFTGHEIEIIITGVGQVATTFALTRAFSLRKPDLALQAGIAGSFDQSLHPGMVVKVREEIFGDLGVEEHNQWMDVFDLGLKQKDDPPFSGIRLVNPHLEKWNHLNLPAVTSLTVNEIITREQRIHTISDKYRPHVESMEGAAFHYTCLQMQIPFLQVRSISNAVGERDKTKWKMQEAIEKLNQVFITIIEQTGI